MTNNARRRELIATIFGVLALTGVVFLTGYYVRNGGQQILLFTVLAALPSGLIVLATSFSLRNAPRKWQLVWCIALLILLKSIQLWKAGVDYRDELRLIKEINLYFGTGTATGYIATFPVNRVFGGIFYLLYNFVWHDLEIFEVLQFFVYPFLIVGLHFMSVEIGKMKSNVFNSSPHIPAIMFLAIAPVFQIIPTYYWPQLLGLTVLCFCVASLLRLLSSEHGTAKWAGLTLGLSILLTFVHNISSLLYLVTIFFFFLTMREKRKRVMLLLIGLITFGIFLAAHLSQYSWLLSQTFLMILGDQSASRAIARLSFTDLSSVLSGGIVPTFANIGFFLTVGCLISIALLRTRSTESSLSLGKRLVRALNRSVIRMLSDPIAFSFAGFAVIALVSGLALHGLFDPVRLIGWGSLLALPVVIPSKKRHAILLMIVLLAIFFFLIWIVNSPWGSPFYSNPNINS